MASSRTYAHVSETVVLFDCAMLEIREAYLSGKCCNVVGEEEAGVGRFLEQCQELHSRSRRGEDFEGIDGDTGIGRGSVVVEEKLEEDW